MSINSFQHTKLKTKKFNSRALQVTTLKNLTISISTFKISKSSQKQKQLKKKSSTKTSYAFCRHLSQVHSQQPNDTTNTQNQNIKRPVKTHRNFIVLILIQIRCNWSFLFLECSRLLKIRNFKKSRFDDHFDSRFYSKK